MIAKKEGLIKKNSMINFEIEIVSYDKSICNETQCNGILNTVLIHSKFQIRVGEEIWFYFTVLNKSQMFQVININGKIKIKK